MGKTPSLPCGTMSSRSFIGQKLGIMAKVGSFAFLVQIVGARHWNILLR